MVTYPSDWIVKDPYFTLEDSQRVPVTASERPAGTTPYYGANGVQGFIDGYTHRGEYVLIAEDGANDISDYPVHYVNGKIWVNNHAHAIRGITGVSDTKYLSYAFKVIDYSAILVGGTRAKLNGSALRAITMPLPNLPEQRAIAEVLSGFDEHLANLDELITKKKAIRDGALEELVTRGLDASLESTAPSWKITRIKEFAEIKRGASPRPIESFLTESPEGINWIKIGDAPKDGIYISRTSERITLEGAKNSVHVNPGDLILSNSMSFGRPYILQTAGCIHDGWLSLQNFSNDANALYLAYLLSSNAVMLQYSAFAAGSGVKNLNKEVVGNVQVYLPSLDEQQAIIEVLSGIDEEIRLLAEERAKVERLKLGAMDDLLTGRVRLPLGKEAA